MKKILTLLSVLFAYSAQSQLFNPPIGIAAIVSPGVYNLTPASVCGFPYHEGAIWCTTTVDFTNGFILTFQESFDHAFGIGADGTDIAFGQNITPTSLNGSNAYLGYYNPQGSPPNPDFNNSFGVELDIFDNSYAPYCDDLPGIDHTAVCPNGIPTFPCPGGAPVGISPTKTNIKDGLFHKYKITWCPATTTLQVFYDDTLRINSVYNYASLFTLPTAVHWGFSAGTGAYCSNQIVQNIVLSPIIGAGLTSHKDTTVCGTASVTLSAGGIGSHLWNTGDTTFNITATHSGTYWVESSNGCANRTDTINVTLSPGILPAPVISGPTPYCQFSTFIPFTITGTPGGTFLWYTSGTGGLGSTTPPIVNTSIPGYTTVWASEKTGACESARDSFTVRVITTPPAPFVTGPASYCQFIGPFLPLHVSTTGTGVTRWYTKSTGGGFTLAEPIVNLNVAGTNNYWVSEADSGCESARTPVTIVVNPKPAPPIVTPQQYCLNWPAGALKATPSGAGDILTWFGATIPALGTTSVPVPPTIVLGYVVDSVNETSSFGCVSDKSIDSVLIKPIPGAPVTHDTTYCQFTAAAPLTADSIPGDRLKWYASGALLPRAPVPTNSATGDSTWYVSQVYNGCESDSTPIKVTTLYKPNFSIVSKPWVCQFDSLSIAYNGPALVNPRYIWSIPYGSSFAAINEGIKSQNGDSMIVVRFDSVTTDNYIHLFTSDYNGMCFFDTVVRITVVPKPYANSFSKRDVCVGDTVSLALSAKSAEASQFTWQVDNAPFATSSAVNILSANSNSGGPFVISWNDSGRHVIQVNTATDQGCKSLPSYDTIVVHTMPDASFKVATGPGSLCMEDSVLFSANTNDYNYGYVWTPAHFFNNVNKPTIWGRVEQSKSIVTLTVTDPFGCIASNSVEIDPGSCCTVNFPNAFSPDGDGHNDFFKPIFAGYHRFHVFRIANRWGQTVYESTNDNMKWDGTFNGVTQDVGVYFYYVKFDCGGNTMEQTGDITLIR